MGIVVRRLLAPGSWLLVPGSCYWLLVPGSWHLVPGSWHLVPGSCRSTWRQKFKQILDELSLCLFGVQYGIQRAQKEILGVLLSWGIRRLYDAQDD